jgi:hypothetical protein
MGYPSNQFTYHPSPKWRMTLRNLGHLICHWQRWRSLPIFRVLYPKGHLNFTDSRSVVQIARHNLWFKPQRCKWYTAHYSNLKGCEHSHVHMGSYLIGIPPPWLMPMVQIRYSCQPAPKDRHWEHLPIFQDIHWIPLGSSLKRAARNLHIQLLQFLIQINTVLQSTIGTPSDQFIQSREFHWLRPSFPVFLTARDSQWGILPIF